jgi:plasmid stabilization system protein ParE
MTFRVSQRARARHDILELAAYIATENPKAAAALYDAYERILATALATTPDIGRPRPATFVSKACGRSRSAGSEAT